MIEVPTVITLLRDYPFSSIPIAIIFFFLVKDDWKETFANDFSKDGILEIKTAEDFFLALVGISGKFLTDFLVLWFFMYWGTYINDFIVKILN